MQLTAEKRVELDRAKNSKAIRAAIYDVGNWKSITYIEERIGQAEVDEIFDR